jgi:hypothetical protein
MKRRHSILVVLVGLLAHLWAEAQTQAGTISISVRPSLSPDLFSSPSSNGYISNAISALQNGTPSIGNPANDPAAYFNVSSVSSNEFTVTGSPGFWRGQTVSSGPFAGEFGNFLEFGVVVTGNISGSGPKIELDKVGFVATSTDPVAFYSGTIPPPLVSSYSAHAVGIVFNSDGSVNHTVTSGPSSQLVDEIVYTGIGLANDASAYPSLAAALAFNQSLGSFLLTGTYTYDDGTGNTGSGSATVSVNPVPEPATLVLLGIAGACSVAARRRKRVGMQHPAQ